MPEVTFDRFVAHLVVTDGRLQIGIPIDQSLAAINLRLAEEVKERVPDGAGADVIERKPGPLPVAAAAQPLELAEDPGFIFVFPLPDSLDQLFPSEVVAGQLFLFLESAFDDCLGRDSRVVASSEYRAL